MSNTKRRKVNVCGPCRKRKVACDQGVPTCGRCLRTNQAERCTYLVDDSVESVQQNGFDDNITVAPPASISPSPLVLPQQTLQYIKKLEDELASTRQELSLHRQLHASASEPFVSHPDHEASQEASGLKGKSFKTRYFGPSYPKSVLGYIPSLTALSKDMGTNSMLAKIRKSSHGSTKINESKPTRTSTSRMELQNLLSSQSEAKALVNLYLDSFDNIFHILHRPTFEAELEQAWSNLEQARPHFLVLVLLVIATASCLLREEPCYYVGKNSITRHKALISINFCEDWLRENYKQKKATITDFQIRFLICLAKAVHGTQFKKGVIEASSALRVCLAAGIHVEPSASSMHTSMLEQEMRRRIWFATAEFELQTAFVRGMPADPLANEGNVAPPSNVGDSELTQEMESVPATQSTAFCESSYLVLARKSFNTRHRLSRLLNSTERTSFEDVRRFTEELQMHIRQIPEWRETPQAEAPRAILKVNLLNYLLVLHLRHLRDFTCAGDRGYSIMTAISSSAEIMEAHTSLLEKGCRVLQQLSHEELRPALSVCYLIEVLDPRADRILHHALKEYAELVTSRVVEVLTDKARHGAGHNQRWLALVAHTLARAWVHPSQATAFKQDAVNSAASGYYKVIASQVNDESAEAGASSSNTSTTFGAVLSQLPRGTPHLLRQDEEEISSIDIEEFSAWTFDEWTFDSRHFQALDDRV